MAISKAIGGGIWRTRVAEGDFTPRLDSSIINTPGKLETWEKGLSLGLPETSSRSEALGYLFTGENELVIASTSGIIVDLKPVEILRGFFTKLIKNETFGPERMSALEVYRHFVRRRLSRSINPTLSAFIIEREEGSSSLSIQSFRDLDVRVRSSSGDSIYTSDPAEFKKQTKIITGLSDGARLIINRSPEREYSPIDRVDASNHTPIEIIAEIIIGPNLFEVLSQ